MTSLRPTTRLAALLVGAALVAAALTGFGAGGGAPALGAAVCLLAAVDARRVLSLPTPRAERPPSVRAVQRHSFRVPLRLEGAEHVCEIAVDWPTELGGPLPPTAGARRASYEVEHEGTPRRRGSTELGPVWLWLASPWRLWRRRSTAPAPSVVHVWPDIEGPAADALGRELRDDGASRTRLAANAGSELRGLKPFQQGDDPRHVDWKATARSQHPVVRQWHPDRQRSVVVVVDAGRLMRAEHDGESKLDAAFRALLRVGLAAQARGDRIGVLVFSNRVLRWVPPLEGTVAVDDLVRILSDVQPSSVQSDPTCAVPQLLSLGRRALLIWLTDVMDGEGARRLLSSAGTATRRHLSLVALLRDPSLDEAFQRPIQTSDDAYRRAAAELVARERAHALEQLRARNVPALDLSMRGLALGVVQRYVEARYDAHW